MALDHRGPGGLTNPAAPLPGTPLCRLDDLADPGSRGFNWRVDGALFMGFVVRQGDEVRGYVDRCPHAGFPLSMVEHRYLTGDGRAVLCQAHGALFRPADGRCLAGPGRTGDLTPWPVRVDDAGLVRVD